MSNSGKKRFNNSQVRENAQKCRKNKHVGESNLSMNGALSDRETSASVSANELLWKEVAPPDRLDDAEGFLGLEEIEDVEVVLDAQGRNPRFQTLTQSERVPLSVSCVQEPASIMSEALLDTDGEWPGFSDATDAEVSYNLSHVSGRTPNGTSNKQKKTPDREASGILSNVPYDVLKDLDEDQAIDVSEWNRLPLSNEIVSAISGLGFPYPTPIQIAVIPEVVAGHDVIGKAVTGSGKTLAFALPIYQQWLTGKPSIIDRKNSQRKPPIALVITPTRELAHQLARHFEDLVAKAISQPRITCVTGGLSAHKQVRHLMGVDIVIATPGRLWEMLNGSDDLSCALRQIRFLVLDEADRLLAEGHFQELEDILGLLDRSIIEEDSASIPRDLDVHQYPRQTLIFSATFHQSLQRKLSSKMSFSRDSSSSNKQTMEYLLQKVSFRESRPKFVDVNPDSQMAQQLREGLMECPALEKDLYLYSILEQRSRARSLVFTNSISSVRRLSSLLKNLGLSVGALHSSMPQKARMRNVERFSEMGKVGEVLVATDVAARGLDIPNIDLILHYHVPRAADTYIHRSGRTARANNAGESVILCSPDEAAGVRKLISQIHGRNYASNPLQLLQVDRQFLGRLKPRLALSQKITNATIAKEKGNSQNNWLRTAAKELGMEDFDSDEFAAEEAKHSRGRGSTKRAKEKEVGAVSKHELSRWNSELKNLLSRPLNLGVSEKYLAGGGVDVNFLLDDDPGKKNTYLAPRRGEED